MKSIEKYFHNNYDIFRRYFDSREQYEALIRAGNFKKMEFIIKGRSEFNWDEWFKSFCEKN